MNQEEIVQSSLSQAELQIQKEDYEIIQNAYKMIKDASQKIGKASNKAYSAIEYCSERDFSVRGVTYEDAIENCSNCFQFSAKNVREYADMVLEALQEGKIEEYLELEPQRRMETEELPILYRTKSEDYNIHIPKGGV